MRIAGQETESLFFYLKFAQSRFIDHAYRMDITMIFIFVKDAVMTTLSELKLMYQEDQLVEAVIESAMVEDTWIVEFRHVHGGLVLLTDMKGGELKYRDLESASKSALAVGFNQVRIND